MLIFKVSPTSNNIESGRLYNPTTEENIYYNPFCTNGLQYKTASFIQTGNTYKWTEQNNYFGTQWRYTNHLNQIVDSDLQSYDTTLDTNQGLYLFKDIAGNFLNSDMGKIEANFWFYPHTTLSQIDNAIGKYLHGGFLICGLFVQFYTWYAYDAANKASVSISPFNSTRLMGGTNYQPIDTWNSGYAYIESYSTKPHNGGFYDWNYEDLAKKNVVEFKSLRISDILKKWIKVKIEKIGMFLKIYIDDDLQLQYSIPYFMNGLFGIVSGKGIIGWKDDILVEIPSYLPKKIETIIIPKENTEIATLEPVLIAEVIPENILTTLTSKVNGTNWLLKDYIKEMGIIKIDKINSKIRINETTSYAPILSETIENDSNTEVYCEEFGDISWTISPNYIGPEIEVGVSSISFDAWIIGQNPDVDLPALKNIEIPFNPIRKHFYIENTNTREQYLRTNPIPFINRLMGSKFYPRRNPMNKTSDLRFYSFPVDGLQNTVGQDYAIYPQGIYTNKSITTGPQRALLNNDLNFWAMSLSTDELIIDLGRNYLTWGTYIELDSPTEVLKNEMGAIKVSVCNSSDDYLNNENYIIPETILGNGLLEFNISNMYRWIPTIGRYIKFTGSKIQRTWNFWFVQIYGQLTSLFEYSIDNGITWEIIPSEGITDAAVDGINKKIRIKIDSSLKLDENYLHSWRIGTVI